ncbi:PHA/PHB synthase family protein [Macromonas nakdongensis]|uniref:PHA/PHB synthase family protein n=1 Tax=Macromonas nakdongensis TaxID=1843082 RepID=UPI000C31EC30|nr:alpha/beta fold hydrolase [Macromonas nakdongensis]
MTPLIAYKTRLTPDHAAVPGLTNRREAGAPAQAAADALDSQAFAQMAHWSSGISPISLALAWTDWVLHLAHSPGSQARLWRRAVEQGLGWAQDATRSAWAGAQPAESAEPAAGLQDDPRFASPLWQQWPWRGLATANKAWESWWQDASGLRGMQAHSREQMRFYGRQVLDLWSPGNWLWTNPQALDAAWRSGGQTLVKGWGYALQDLQAPSAQPPAPADAGADLVPGQGVAVTPGQVVMRNNLVELIQYRPTTAQVHAEPLLIIPSCIMKYYILDLSPHNSMVRWLVDQGHTVYIVSWRNPDEDDALLTMDDYVQEGVLAALAHVHQASQAPVHLMGYCLGGTFAAIAAAALGGGDAHLLPGADETALAPLASLSLLAAETDFSDPGEMGILIDEAQVRLLEDMMAAKGFLTGRQMAASFQFLHARELVWSSRTRRWLLGEEEVPNDLMCWNTDVTRLPAVMHSQYLRTCFLNNDLAEGRFLFAGRPIALCDIRCPVFAVGTLKDHVAPWKSVYKIHRLVSAEVTFVLTSGGHNAGIVSEPGHPGRHYQQLRTGTDMPWRTPEEWQAQAPHHDGSWWPAWSAWLVEQGPGAPVAARAPARAASLGEAPGSYVKVRYGD